MEREREKLAERERYEGEGGKERLVFVGVVPSWVTCFPVTVVSGEHNEEKNTRCFLYM